MKSKYFLFLPLACLLFLVACSGNMNDNSRSVKAEVKDMIDSNKKAEELLRKQVIGTWSSVETVRGETIVFDERGNYSGYDGRDEFEGTWEIKSSAINLSKSGLFYLKIEADTMFLDSTKYVRQAPALTQQK